MEGEMRDMEMENMETRIERMDIVDGVVTGLGADRQTGARGPMYAIVPGTPEWTLMSKLVLGKADEVPEGEFWDPTGDAVVLRTADGWRMKCAWSDWEWVDVAPRDVGEIQSILLRREIAMYQSREQRLIVYTAYGEVE